MTINDLSTKRNTARIANPQNHVLKIKVTIITIIMAAKPGKPGHGSEKRLSALQSLRGIAALVVVLRHSTFSFPSSGPQADFFENIVFNSHAAVVVFFVLSGFVLSASLDNRKLSFPTLAGFYIKRLFRILPLLIFLTILSLLYTLSDISSVTVGGSTQFFRGLLDHSPPKPVTVLLSLVGLNSHYVPQNWTIMVELLVAPFFPFLFFFSRNNHKIFALLFIVTLIASMVAPLGGRFLPFVYTVDFMLGIGVFLFWSRKMPADIPFLTTAVIIALIILISARPFLTLCHLSIVNPTNFHDPVSGFIEALAASALIFGLAVHTKLARALSHPCLVFLGDISFSLYLVHFLVIVLLGRFIDRLVPEFSDLNDLARNLIFAIIVVLISIPISALLYSLLELPWNRFGRRLATFDIPERASQYGKPPKAVIETPSGMQS